MVLLVAENSETFTNNVQGLEKLVDWAKAQGVEISVDDFDVEEFEDAVDEAISTVLEKLSGNWYYYLDNDTGFEDGEYIVVKLAERK